MKFNSLCALAKSHVKTAVLLMRFHTEVPKYKTIKYCSYKAISKALAIPYATVQYLCRNEIQYLKTKSSKQKVRILEQEHIEFLINKKTLQLWAGKTMKQRTVLFHRRFTNKRIAESSLRRLYLQHKVKQKQVR